MLLAMIKSVLNLMALTNHVLKEAGLGYCDKEETEEEELMC